MIGIRLSEAHERRLRDLARQAGMKPGPYARRVLIAHLEAQAQADSVVSGRLSRLEEGISKLGRLCLGFDRKFTDFLENVDVVDRT